MDTAHNRTAAVEPRSATIIQGPSAWTGSPVTLVAGVVDLISLPEAYLRTRDLINDPDSSMAMVAQVISTDPNLAGRVLRLSNSAFFGFASRIDTITRAVNILGLKLVHDLALATSAVRVFDRIPNTIMSMPKFWRRSVYCGVMAKLLAKHAGAQNIERFFVAGLMHRLGSLVLYYRVPELSVNALQQSRDQARPVAAVERELLGFDYAAVGGELLRAWQLPASLQHAVGTHTEPARSQEEFRLETSIIHLASVIAIAADNKGDQSEFVPDFDIAAFQLLGLGDDAIEPLMQEADIQTTETVLLLTGSS